MIPTFFVIWQKFEQVSELSKHLYEDACVVRTYRTWIGRRWLI